MTSSAMKVDRISIVKPEDTSDLNVEKGKDLMTLLTCTPYGVNTERLLVRGHRFRIKRLIVVRKILLSAWKRITFSG